MKQYIYSRCPACKHPNVHVYGGRLATHYAGNSEKPCVGSGQEAPEVRLTPRKRRKEIRVETLERENND